MGDVAIEESVGLKLTMFLVRDSCEYKKAKDVNKNVVTILDHYEYKDNLSNKKCLRHIGNRIQAKNRGIS